MMKNIIPIFVMSLVILFGCKQDEELISGSINGYIYLTDENGYSVNAGSIPVALVKDTIAFQTQTESDGWFSFDAIPIGNYDVHLTKTGYVVSKLNPQIQHIGGYSPTYEIFSMIEIPKISFHIDSISATQNYGWDRLKFYGKILNFEKRPRIGYSIRIYVHNSPDISISNFEADYSAYIMDRGIEGVNFEFQVDINRFYQDGDKIYFIVCPVASVSDWYLNRSDARGPISEVFEWQALSK